MTFIPSEDIPEFDGIDPEAFDEGEPKRITNPEERQILSAVRDIVPLNPQLKAEVIKYTLAQVHATISLYHERKKTSPVKNPPGWIIEALRNGWATPKNSPNSSKTPRTNFPAELVRWYEWACRNGIVDGRELRHCLYSSGGSPARAIDPVVDDLLVAVTVPDAERRPFDPPYRFIPWQEAMTRFPMPQGVMIQGEATHG